jgi:tripartite-type tricarboxylate transporter receptor subunit TctC
MRSIALLARALLFGLALITCGAWAGDAYPSKPVHLLVAFPPGGTTDLLARIVAQKLSPRLGQQVVVENKPSAGGILGTDSIAKAAPDGYNLLMVPSLHGTNLSLYSKLPYDTVKDFAPVALLATSPYVLVTNPALPAKNVPELVSYLKQRPGKLNMSASAVASPQHLAAELFKRSAGVDVLLVPYKGSGSILPDLIAGRVSLAFENQAVVLPHIQSGALRALAVSSPERSALLPNVPTLVESGLDNFVVIGWFGIMAPAQTPPEIIKKLNAEISAVMQEPDVRERIAAMGAKALSGPPSDLRDLLAHEIDVWGRVIRDAHIRLD